MDGVTRPRVRTPVLRMLAGIETGVVGGVAMLGWFALHSSLMGLYWWTVPNLIASVFSSTRAIRSSFGLSTVTGIALHLLISGAAGAVFGLVVSLARATRGRAILLGLVAGLLMYYATWAAIWRDLTAGHPATGWLLSILAGHLIFGFCLARYPRRLNVLERSFNGD